MSSPAYFISDFIKSFSIVKFCAYNIITVNRYIGASMPKTLKKTSFPTLPAWILFCFFFSGMAGLIYQVLWLRIIGKVIGSAPFAVATVLSVFMGGLALGSRLAGKRIDRIDSRRSLLSLYGKLELAIGIYGLLLPLLIYGVKPLYVLVYDSLFLHFWAYRFFAFFGCALVLLVPTALMGAALPILCRFYVEDLRHIGTRTGRLYGINTIGAAAGAIICGFVLITEFGVRGTLGTAVGINILVGLLCIALARRSEPLAASPEKPPNALEKPSTSDDRDATRIEEQAVVINLALWIFAASGFCAMAYEVFWTRLLGLIIGPTTYSFSLVVSTFIIGLALGNLFFGWFADRIKSTFILLVATQICAACLALLVSQFLGNSQFFFSKLIYTFQDDFGGRILLQSVVLFFILIGPTIFMGAAFPLVNKIYARSLPNIGRSIGNAYAVNTIGAILGSFVAGFILIPFIGKENGLRITAGLQLFISIAALMFLTFKIRKNISTAATALATLFAGLLLLSNFPSWNHDILSKGWYYRFEALEKYFNKTSWMESIWNGSSEIARLVAGREVVFYGDGAGGFTAVDKYVDPTGTDNYILLNNGKSDASSHDGRLTQALSAHIPLLFHPDPKKVMVLGLASGMTAGEALCYPLTQLDVIEINDQVIKAAEFFTPYNNNCLTNPKTRIIAQDGRNHLELTRESYDVIVSVPSSPWMAGMANVFSLDYFETVKRRLNGNGIFAQWISSHDMDWETFSMIGRTFAEAFPDGLLIRTAGTSEFLLLGFGSEKNLDPDIAGKNLVYAEKSKNITIRDPKVIFNLIVAEDLKRFFDSGSLHTDNWPLLEFAAPRSMSRTGRSVANRLKENTWLSAETRKIIESNKSIDRTLDYIELLTAGASPPFTDVDLENATSQQLERFQRIMDDYCSDAYVTNYSIFPSIELQKKCAGVQIAKIQSHLADTPEDATAYFRLAGGLETMGAPDAGIDALRTAISLDPSYFDAHMKLGEMLSDLGNFDEAATQLTEALQIDPNSAKAHNNLGSVFEDLGNTNEAISHFTKAFKIDPDYARAYNNLGCVYANLNDTDEAIYYFTKAIDIEPEYADVHNNLGRVLAGQGRLDEALAHFLEAVRIAPETAVFHNDVGLVQGQLGSMDTAIEKFTEALRLDPELVVAHYNLGLALLNKEQFEASAKHLIKVAEMSPDDPEVHKMLGFAMGNLGRLEEAAGHLSKALELDPNSAVTHDNMGVALLKLGHVDEAIDHFHEALNIDESLDSALDHLKIAVTEREKTKGRSASSVLN